MSTYISLLFVSINLFIYRSIHLSFHSSYPFSSISVTNYSLFCHIAIYIHKSTCFPESLPAPPFFHSVSYKLSDNCNAHQYTLACFKTAPTLTLPFTNTHSQITSAYRVRMLRYQFNYFRVGLTFLLTVNNDVLQAFWWNYVSHMMYSRPINEQNSSDEEYKKTILTLYPSAWQ